MGYVLPWGQMSFWGAKVITNLFSAIPFFGDAIVTWLWGGYSVDNPTLNRFFSLHYLLPFVLAGLVVLHIWALHVPGNNNPVGVIVKSGQDTVPFHPYYTMKDAYAIVVFLILFAAFMFFAPNYLGHADQLRHGQSAVDARPYRAGMVFPAFLRDSAIASRDKLLGVIAMFGSILILFVLPWLDTSQVRSAHLPSGISSSSSGSSSSTASSSASRFQPAGGSWLTLGRIATAYYFLHFLVILPLLGLLEVRGRCRRRSPRRSCRHGREVGRQSPRAGEMTIMSSHPRSLRLVLLGLTAIAAPALAAEEKLPAKDILHFRRAVRHFRPGQLQRGYKVYKEVCAACHSMRLLRFRNLGDPGGPEFTAEQVKAMAATYTGQDGPR